MKRVMYEFENNRQMQERGNNLHDSDYLNMLLEQAPELPPREDSSHAI